MTIPLTDLEPVLEDFQPNEHGYQCFTFLCPTCRRLRLRHAIWSRPAGEASWIDAEGNKCGVRVWHAEQGPYRDWNTLSLTPSLNTAPHKLGTGECPGWHGFITNGEAT